jgi:hypothetical protein
MLLFLIKPRHLCMSDCQSVQQGNVHTVTHYLNYTEKQKFGTGTNFIPAALKIRCSVNGSINILWSSTRYVLLCNNELLFVFKDVKSTATNDDQYFVFEDLLYQVILFMHVCF